MNGKLLGLVAIVGLGMVGWKVGSVLNSDAIAMAVGVLFGILAGVPTSLLILASRHRAEPTVKAGETHYHYHGAPGPAQLPVAPKIDRLEYEVESIPGYRAWKMADQDLIWISKNGTDKEWTRSATAYFQYLNDYNMKQLEDKQAR